MRALVLSSVFPSRMQPTFGVFVRERIRHVAAHCEVVVVAPIPWVPFNGLIRGKEYAATPFVEEQDALAVYHPRFLCLPRFGKCLDGVLYFLSLLPFLIWLRRRFPFDVIDAHFAYPDGLAGVLLGKVFGRPTLITLRGTHDLRHAGYRLRRPQIAFALKAAARLISVSRSLQQFIANLGVDPARVRVIPNGVDVSRFFPADRQAAREKLGLPYDRVILLAVGGLIELKGHHRVLEILPGLISRRSGLLYVAIGDDGPGQSYRHVIEGLVRRHSLEEYVRLVPPRPHDEIPLWMAAADFFCLATRMEGCCNAIMESLACGLPVVTTRVGGNVEFVQDGRDGILVPFWDGSAFGNAILRALELDWDRPAIAARARANGWDRTAEHVLEEFRLALTPRHTQFNYPVSH